MTSRILYKKVYSAEELSDLDRDISEIEYPTATDDSGFFDGCVVVTVEYIGDNNDQ